MKLKTQLWIKLKNSNGDKSFDTDTGSWLEFYMFSTVTLQETRLRKEVVQVESSCEY